MNSNDKNNKFSYILSFVLSSLCTLIFLTLMDVGIGGTHCIIDGDMREVYIPAIKTLCTSILRFENIFYTWNSNMGINNSLNIAYYCLSPFNLFYLLFYSSDEQYITLFLIVIRTGLAATLFNVFVSKVHKTIPVISILFSIAYSMCAFHVAFNITNIIWIDALWELPLLFLFIHQALDEKKYIRLALFYAFVFISNFYMGYMLGIISFTYFILQLFIAYDMPIKVKLNATIRYFIAVFLAIGISSIVWLPLIIFLKNNYAGDSTKFYELSNNILSVLGQLYFGQTYGHYSSLPYIYCGIPAVLLLPAYYIKNRNKKSMIVHTIILVFTLISCLILPLYELWHGFDSPDGWTFRFGYIISFILCTIAAQSLAGLQLSGKKLFGYCVLFTLISTLLLYFTGTDLAIVSINVILFIIWSILFIIWYRPSNLQSMAMRCFVIAFAVIEITSNATLIHILSPEMTPQMRQGNYLVWKSSQKNIVKTLRKDISMYRVNNTCDYNMNPGAYFGYSSMSYFNTVENPRVRNTLAKLGLYTSPRVVQGYGLTNVTKMLFDVQYDVHTSYYDVFDNYNKVEYEVNTNKNILPIGYMVSDRIKEVSLTSEDAFANTNLLIDAMTGNMSDHIYVQVPYEDVLCSFDGFSLYADDQYYYIELTDKTLERGINDNRYYEFSIDSEGHNQIYSYISNDESMYSSNSFILEGGAENSIYYKGKLSVSYIKPMEMTDGRYRLRIIPDDEIDYQNFVDIIFYEIDDTALSQAYTTLSANTLTVNKFMNGYVEGTVNVEDSSDILFTSIPYEEGWSVTDANGRDLKLIPVLDGTFVGIEFPEAGEYHITLDYDVPGLMVGTICSLVSLLLLIGYLQYFRLISHASTKQHI